MSKVQWLQFPLAIKWYITGRCNLRCSHCYLSSYVDHPDLTKILNVIDFLATKNLYSISLLGGEPLLRSDLETIIQKLSSYKIKTSIASNATLLTQERARSIYEAGLKEIQVSLESNKENEHNQIRGKGTFYKTLNGMNAALKEGIKVTLAFTIKKTNIDEIPEYFKFAKEAGVQSIRLMPFLPIGTGGNNEVHHKLSNDDFTRCSDIISSQKHCFPDLKVNSYFTDLKPNCSSCNQSTFGCGAGTTSLVINSDFSLSACDVMVEEDRTHKIVAANDIETYWNNHPLFSKWRGNAPSDSTPSLANFANVHLSGCHVLNQTYQR